MSTILTHNLASGTSYRYCDIFVIDMDYNILESYVGINYAYAGDKPWLVEVGIKNPPKMV